MEKNTKLLISGLVVLVIVAVLFRGQLTGKVIICSERPEFTSVRAVGDTVSLGWTDTSTLKGKQIKYELLLFKQKEDGTYDFNQPDKDDNTADTYYAFPGLKEGKYVVKINAKNPSKGYCPGHSGFTLSEEVEVMTE